MKLTISEKEKRWITIGAVAILAFVLTVNMVGYYFAAPEPQALTLDHNAGTVLAAFGSVNSSRFDAGTGRYNVTLAVQGGAAFTFSSPVALNKGDRVGVADFIDPVFIPVIHPLGEVVPRSWVVIEDNSKVVFNGSPSPIAFGLLAALTVGSFTMLGIRDFVRSVRSSK